MPAPAADARIQLHGPFEARDAQGQLLTVTGIDIAREGYIADVFVRLAEPFNGPLYDDSTFVAYVRDKLRSAGYTGPGFERAESGMQGTDFVVLEPNRAFAGFARAKGWTDLSQFERSWTRQPGEVTEPSVKMQEVTFTYHLRPTDHTLLDDASYERYSRYMDAVDQMLQHDVRNIPGWVVKDHDDIECDVYDVCDPQGHYPGSDVDEVGPYGHLVLELTIQARRAWEPEEVQRIADALRAQLDIAMTDFHLTASLHEVRSFTRFEHTAKDILFKAIASTGETE